MKNGKINQKLASTIVISLLIASMMAFALPAYAQSTLPSSVIPTNVQEGGSIPLPSGVTPDYQVDTTAYLSFRPNPVGVGQPVLVNVWLTPATHVSRYLSDYKVTITAPDGTVETKTLDSYRADTTAWFEFTPDQTGDYKLKFEFPGGYYPAGNYTVAAGAFVGAQTVNFVESSYYKPSATGEQILTVQNDMVNSWPVSQLPTDYWTRPVSIENREWVAITGDFPWYGPGWGASFPEDTNRYWSGRYQFTPYVEAPESAHVAWKRLNAINGLIGSDYGYEALTSSPGNPGTIFQGRAYQTMTVAGGANVLRCYNIRTGEIFWEIPNPAPASTTAIFAVPVSFVMEYDSGTSEVPGAEARSGSSVSLVATGSGRIIKINPLTGAVTANLSMPTGMTSATYYMNGHALGIQNLGSSLPVNERYRLINFTTFGNSADFSTRVQGNISWAMSGLGTAQDFNAGITVQVAALTPAAIGAWTGTTLQGYSLTTGAMLWNITIPETSYSTTVVVADHGKVAVAMMDGTFVAYNLNDGSVAWTSERFDYPWAAPGFGAYSIQSAYGMLYRETYDGVYAIDWDDGSIVWHYIAYTPYNYETPYIDQNGTSVYSFNAGGLVADGKLYVYNTEHTPTAPITRGWRLHCIDVFTGKGVWNITGAQTPGSIADGYLTAANTYDGYMYVYGKGKSETTVSAPQTAVTVGSKILISGTVMDLSPGQPNTPCVSEQSMTEWMEYIHMQKACPSDVTGVSVSLDAVDPNGNSIHIGEAVSDMSGTYRFDWAPENAGVYTITATFMGSTSYGSSWAETGVVAVEAPQETTAPTTSITNPPYEMYTIGMGVAIIIAIALAVVLLRKRP